MMQEKKGRVAGKVALITGGASGVGREDALLFAREGARVVITDVNAEAGAALAREIGADALFLRQDITREEDWQQVMAATVERFGRLDVLVNNAGILLPSALEETTLELWRKIQTVNVEGYFLGCKHAVQTMKQTGGGSIVNMSSLAGLSGLAMFPAYCASKHAVVGLSRSVAAYCKTKGYNIRSNTVHPDGINTPMIAAMADHMDLLSQVTSRNPDMPRSTDPINIANVVLFLASDESQFINGAELRVDNAFLSTGD